MFTPSHFLDLGSDLSVWKAIQVLADRQTIQQLARGLYHYPKTHPKLGVLSPTPDKIAGYFESAIGDPHRITVAKNANLRLWRWMWRVMMCGWPGRGNALFQALLRVVTPLLCRCHFGACYRTIIWVEPGDRK